MAVLDDAKIDESALYILALRGLDALTSGRLGVWTNRNLTVARDLASRWGMRGQVR